jgi:hypothetical protein
MFIMKLLDSHGADAICNLVNAAVELCGFRTPRSWRKLVSAVAAGASVVLAVACASSTDSADTAPDPVLLAEGQKIFRFDTFGDETQWTDTLRMHEVIRSAVDPTTALSVGLKVDSEALPASVVQGIQNGSVDLKSPETTVALLKLNAVVGLQGKVEVVNGKDTLTRVGVTCALCHSTVAGRRDLRAVSFDSR